MYTYTVPELYLEYTEARRLNLSYEQFSAFVTFYPALLVAHTDGTVDDKEWQFIRALADDLIRISSRKDICKEEIKDLQLLFFNEFKYLICHFDQWERKFMKTLKRHLIEKPEEKAAVMKIIYMLADASDGICEKESVMIEHLSHELDIYPCLI
jgi:tellurite resistance protein